MPEYWSGMEYESKYQKVWKCTNPNALELGPRKKLTAQDPLVHHGCHFGHAVHSFCNMQALVSNGTSPNDTWLEACIMDSPEKEVIDITDLIQKGAKSAHADNTKGTKSAIINWITPKGQSLNPHIPWNVKASHGFNHEHPGALLCPAGLDWNNNDTKNKLINRQIQVAGDEWPVFLYANYSYDIEDLWNGLLHSGLLVSLSAFKHIFTCPSSVDQEPKATCSGNAHIHAHFALTLAQVFSWTDLVANSGCFYNSIVMLLDNPEEKDEVDQLLTW
ncbi:hypothetical protein PAXRUDRAFT_36737 [Paxillus rubicundulus Ve08.2h10]|uniref:Uncharacterized protein n=1 Tax=Paxillus rubicundulus Ve08.2h10 TaxID=930991 RepID=A0A0D0DB70_9AGAM|nr:hypothetical protein PAXRUDRAFT_36737 [Paxillus rubicundulus Ve08.2h10]